MCTVHKYSEYHIWIVNESVNCDERKLLALTNTCGKYGKAFKSEAISANQGSHRKEKY